MKRGGRLKAGKKTNIWAKVRAELKIEFEAQGITTCELRFKECWIDNGLGFAHAQKRRFIKPDDKTVILACNHCHDSLEVMPHASMERIVLSTIAARSVAKTITVAGCSERG